jgi:hypothetical protein
MTNLRSKSKRAFRGLLGSSFAEIDVVTPYEKPIQPLSPDETEQLVRETRKQLGVIEQDSGYVNSVRRFFSMTVENVAMFLTMPVFYNNQDGYETIHVKGVPFKQKSAKHPINASGRRAPDYLYEQLDKIRDELNTTFKATYSKKHGGLKGKDLTRAQRSKKIERERIEKKIAQFENDWTKKDVPGTGRHPFDIQIPKGSVVLKSPRCYSGYSRSLVKKYIAEAWQAVVNHGDEDKPDFEILSDVERRLHRLNQAWEFHWSELENAVIQRALDRGVFCLCPDAKAAYHHFLANNSQERALDHSSSPRDDPKSAHWVRPGGAGPSHDERTWMGGQDRD